MTTMPTSFAAIADTHLSIGDDFAAVSVIDRLLAPGLSLRLFNAEDFGNFQQVALTPTEARLLAAALLKAADVNEARHAL